MDMHAHVSCKFASQCLVHSCTTVCTCACPLQALGASVANLAKTQRAVKAGVMLLDAPSGGDVADKAAAITQLAS
eukprot:scaffold27429_cov23-Tisochrysis_lutea.AAC.1